MEDARHGGRDGSRPRVTPKLKKTHQPNHPYYSQLQLKIAPSLPQLNPINFAPINFAPILPPTETQKKAKKPKKPKENPKKPKKPQKIPTQPSDV